ncbi:MAG: serpin family protein [Ardenticatenaceae bacterium]
MNIKQPVKQIFRLMLVLMLATFLLGCGASSEPTTSPEPTESSEPTPSSEPTESSEPTPSSQPTESSEPTPSSEPTESTEATESSEPMILISNKPRLTGRASESELAELASGNSAFAFELYQQLRNENEEGNLFYSPYSISLALAMTYAGAAGDTAQQMADTLHYSLPQAPLHPAFNALDTTLSSYGEAEAEEENRFQLNIANRIWGQAGYGFLPTYLDTLAENYGAGLQTLDFANHTEEARQTINEWVSEQTEEKIQDLIPSGLLDPTVRLVLTNAIYFNGKWVQPFEKDATHDDQFTLLDGSTVTVPMMSQTGFFGYAQADGYQAVALPYRGADMAMLVLLPQAGRFDEIEAAFSSDNLTTISDQLTPQNVRLFVPKFTFESKFNLSDTLAKMGMPVAFSDQADFSGMTGNRDLLISNVLHKAFVAVDEAGTEAAAATSVGMTLSSAPVDPALMRLDRPFLFLIRDNRTGTILFVGRVLNPEG